jgi:hypothetical protein
VKTIIRPVLKIVPMKRLQQSGPIDDLNGAKRLNGLDDLNKRLV